MAKPFSDLIYAQRFFRRVLIFNLNIFFLLFVLFCSEEAERIKQFKGRVFPLQDEPDVACVWLPHGDSPGLAMARAFVDFCLNNFGLIVVPDISYHPQRRG